MANKQHIHYLALALLYPVQWIMLIEIAQMTDSFVLVCALDQSLHDKGHLKLAIGMAKVDKVMGID